MENQWTICNNYWTFFKSEISISSEILILDYHNGHDTYYRPIEILIILSEKTVFFKFQVKFLGCLAKSQDNFCGELIYRYVITIIYRLSINI